MKEPPVPLEEVLRWCEANRPDVVADIRQLPTIVRHEGLMLILNIAFNAGRTYQRASQHADVLLPIKKDPYGAHGWSVSWDHVVGNGPEIQTFVVSGSEDTCRKLFNLLVVMRREQHVDVPRSAYLLDAQGRYKDGCFS